jgi:hypothetical protein
VQESVFAPLVRHAPPSHLRRPLLIAGISNVGTINSVMFIVTRHAFIQRAARAAPAIRIETHQITVTDADVGQRVSGEAIVLEPPRAYKLKSFLEEDMPPFVWRQDDEVGYNKDELNFKDVYDKDT